jgi:hypothetical protein
MDNSVYYLTGMGGHLHAGLGQALLSRGIEVIGRELVGEFRRLDFQQQVDLIVSDLQTNFWQENARVIANSFGAHMNFIPPRAEKLLRLAEDGIYPIPKTCEVHVGSEDWQSNPANVTAFGSKLGIDVTVVPNAGHNLPKEYVGVLLDSWLAVD